MSCSKCTAASAATAAAFIPHSATLHTLYYTEQTKPQHAYITRKHYAASSPKLHRRVTTRTLLNPSIQHQIQINKSKSRIYCNASSSPPADNASQIPSANGNTKDADVETTDDGYQKEGGLTEFIDMIKPNPIDKDIVRLSLPAIGALALDPIVALADTALLGHLGSLALGGVGISNNVFNLSFTVFNFLGMATTPTIAQQYGAGELQKASRTIARGLWISVIVGLTAIVALGTFTEPVVRFFGANETVLPYAVKYLRARVMAAPFFLACMVCQAAFRGFQDTRTPFLMSIVANMVNLTLFPLLIFGAKMGVRGAGIATAMSQMTLTIGLFFLMVKKGMLRLPDLAKPPSMNKVIPLLRTGAVLSMRTFSILSTVSFATATAARMGTAQIAAFEVTRQIFALLARLFDALSVAAQSLIPVELGKKDFVRARQVSRRLLQVGFLMGLFFMICLQVGGPTLARAFSNDPVVISMITSCFPIISVFEPLIGLVFVLDGCFTAGRQFTFLAVAIAMASGCAWMCLFATRALNLGLQAVWVSLNVMMVLRVILLGSRYFSPQSPVPKRKNGTVPVPVPVAVETEIMPTTSTVNTKE